jgi:predicted secreted protein
MTPFTLAATFVIVWWLVLFVALPIGIKNSPDSLGRGQMAGAPEKPMLLRKIVWTTLAALVVTAAIGYASQFDLPDFAMGPAIPTGK